MDTPLLELLVAAISLVAGGSAYFGWRSFDRRPPLATTIDGVQEAEIEVRNGYRPNAVRVRAGQPVRLRFRRVEDDPCSARIYLADPPLARQLAPFATTAITFTPRHAGRHLFTCEEGRHRGYLIVEAPASPMALDRPVATAAPRQ